MHTYIHGEKRSAFTTTTPAATRSTNPAAMRQHIHDDDVLQPEGIDDHQRQIAVEDQRQAQVPARSTGGTVISRQMLAPTMAKRGLSAPEASGRLRFWGCCRSFSMSTRSLMM